MNYSLSKLLFEEDEKKDSEKTSDSEVLSKLSRKENILNN